MVPTLKLIRPSGAIRKNATGGFRMISTPSAFHPADCSNSSTEAASYGSRPSDNNRPVAQYAMTSLFPVPLAIWTAPTTYMTSDITQTATRMKAVATCNGRTLIPDPVTLAFESCSFNCSMAAPSRWLFHRILPCLRITGQLLSLLSSRPISQPRTHAGLPAVNPRSKCLKSPAVYCQNWRSLNHRSSPV
jgi:hypothetical protein